MLGTIKILEVEKSAVAYQRPKMYCRQKLVVKDLVALPAGVSVGELVDLPGGVLLGELLLDVLVGEVLHAPSVYLVQRPPPLLGRVDVRRGLKRTLLKLQRTRA